jgi:ligand-binding SRPBCC domain-containing protein
LERLERVQRLDSDLEEVFAFFSDPANLARITPPWLRFRIHRPPERMEAGARIEYRIRWLIFRLRWITRITAWSPPRLFEDIQETGPYRVWRHTHQFAREGDGTVVRDRVDYQLPLGPLGRLAHRLLVRRQLAAIFDYRQREIARFFGSREGGGA